MTLSVKDQDRFGPGTGTRHMIGACYLAGSVATRNTLVDYWGKGEVRHGLLVVAAARHTNDDDAKVALDLAESMRQRRKTNA